MRFSIKKHDAKVYKVVRRNARGGLESALSHRIPASWCVRYVPGRWTFPVKKNTGLFAFKNLTSARRFNPGMWPLEVWECRAHTLDGDLHQWSGALRCAMLGWRAFVKFWKSPKEAMASGQWESHHAISGPHGGVWCSRIKLVRRIR